MNKEDYKTEIVIILNNMLGYLSDDNIDKYWEIAEEIVKIDLEEATGFLKNE